MRLFAGTEFDQPPICERCGRLESLCNCLPLPAEPISPSKQTANLRLEKRKKGKKVTTVSGLDPTGYHLSELLTELKQACGAGGTIQQNIIEIQGEHVDRVRQLLKQRGYQTKG